MNYDLTNVEYAVLQHILHLGVIGRAEAKGIRPWHFSDYKLRDCYEKILNFSKRRATRNQTPSLSYMSKMCPDYPHSDQVPEWTLDELVNELLNGALRRELEATAEDLKLMVEQYDQPDIALNYLAEKCAELREGSEIPEHLRMGVQAGLSSALEHYTQIKSGSGVLGTEWPWAPFNKKFQGICNGKLYVAYAPAKGGKSWWLLYGGCVYPFIHSNSKVLFITTEMPADEVWDRIACLLAKVKYAQFMGGSLAKDEEKRFVDTIEALKEEDYNRINIPESVEDQSNTGHRRIEVVYVPQGTRVDVIEKLVEEVDPDIVCLDGIYNIVGTGSDNLSKINNGVIGIKKLAVEKNVPIIATAQTNRSGWIDLKELDIHRPKDIGDSYKIVVYVDALIRLHRFKSGTDHRGESIWKQYVNVPAGRQAHVEPFVLNFVPGGDHTIFAQGVSPKEASEWANTPDDEEDPFTRGRSSDFLG